MSTRRKNKKKRFNTKDRTQQYLALKKYFEAEAAEGRFTGSIIRAIADNMRLSESTVYKIKRIVEIYSENEIEKITNINTAYRQACRLNDTPPESEAEEETPQTEADDSESLSTAEPEVRIMDDIVEGIAIPLRRLEGLIDANAKDAEVIDLICSALRVVDHINKIQLILETTHQHSIDEE